MKEEEVLRLVEVIHRDQEIDKETVFQGLESAFASALKKQFNLALLPEVSINRASGAITAHCEGKSLDISSLGRVAFHTVRQAFTQKLKEAKTTHVFSEFAVKQGLIISCRLLRQEAGFAVCEIGRKVEAILPRREQIAGETHPIGSRFKAYLLEIEKRGSDVQIILSRYNENFVKKLFDMEVPEIQNGTCVVKGIARDAGYRSKILVQSTNEKVDCVGACVGVRGSRIKNIVDELNGENIDIIPFSADDAELVRNSLKPAAVADVTVDRKKRHATVYVDKSELSLAIGKGGRNVRLASRLTGWEIDVFELVAQGSDQAQATEPKG